MCLLRHGKRRPWCSRCELNGASVDITALSMGNPHAVQEWCRMSMPRRLPEQGPLIENHPRFPQRVNAGFMQVTDRHAIRLRVL
ncbi:MAG: hypothetical protein M5R42_00025 [Rhodocyclaceae bacterium]|nr:hypothetical protein [Rhodocyclaceae bacterium]